MNKQDITQHFDKQAPQRSHWFHKNLTYHQQIIDVCQQFINSDSRVLELGCSTGDLLARLNPNFGLGIDISPKSIDVATKTYPHLNWLCADVENLPAYPLLAEPFDIIIVEDLTGYLQDIQGLLENIKDLMHPNTRLIISTWNWLWEPVLTLGETIGQKLPDINQRQNWISKTALELFLELADYEILATKPGLLLPLELPIITQLANSLSYAPVLERLTLLSILVARPKAVEPNKREYSVSVIIPTRNEAGNIRDLVERTPNMGSHTELIFVDGNSTDGTIEEIHKYIALHPELDIKYIPQVPSHDPDAETSPNLMLKLGKGDAVRKGFQAAKGEILMILDSDISVPPEQLGRFYNVLASGKARFANGTRFVYTQEHGAMKPLNRFGNIFFSRLFTWLLDQEISDTLCGTKVLFKQDYEAIAANRSYFGDFDPFGDFDLLFGAAYLEQSIKDVPITYLARTYGESKVRVSQHGPLLGRMVLIGLLQLKIRPLLFGKSKVSKSRGQNDNAKSQNSFALAAIAFMSFLLLLLVGWFMKDDE